jgi:hypothetical protein
VLLVALLVRFEEPVELGSFVTGNVRISLSAWQALVFPFAIAALAGASGGVWSWASSAPDPSAVRTRAVLGGGWRMFLFALALSYLGLFVAGIAQPDEAVRPRNAIDGSVRRYRVRAAGTGIGPPRPSPRALAERGDLDLRAGRGRV